MQAENAASRVSLEALHAVSSAMSASVELEVALPEVLERLLRLFDFPAGIIRLLDAPTGELVLATYTGFEDGLLEEVRSIRVGDAPAGLSALRRELIVFEDLQAGPYAASPWARAGMRTFVSVPLQGQRMLVGCLNLTDRRVRSFGRAERELLQTLANQIGMGIANAELYAAARRKIECLSALHQCSQDLGPAPDLERVFQLTTERMAKLLRLQRSALFTVEPETRTLVGAAACCFPEAAVRALRVPLAELPLAQSALQERQPVTSDAPAGEGLLPAEFVRAAAVGPALAVPLIANDRPIGLLVADRGGEPLEPTTDETELAMIFANQAAVWIANATLFIGEQAARARAETTEARFRELLESAPDAIVAVDRGGEIVLANQETERMFGYPREELLGQPVELLLPERARAAHVHHRGEFHQEPRRRPMGAGLDLAAARKDGSEFPVEISLSPTGEGDDLLVISVIRDITERKRSEEERARLLVRAQEKSEQLKLSVREAHHRIKNNLQAISDLLYLELSAGDGDGAPEALRESMERVQAIALVHDLLSQDDDVRVVDARAVVDRLVPMVFRSNGLSPERLELQVRVPAVPLSSKKATTLALILNELLSNAAKHAFAARQGGRLGVSLEYAQDGLLLRVQDDGPGLPEDFSLADNAHVGLHVVSVLAERDLDGKLSFGGGPGLAVEVWFPW